MFDAWLEIIGTQRIRNMENRGAFFGSGFAPGLDVL
jgi:hypothetical protein